MSQHETALAQRLALLTGCWRPGMLSLQYCVPARLVGQDDLGRWNAWDRSGVWVRYTDMAGIVPDLTDPATVGCLAEWCREVYGVPSLHAAILMGRKSPTGGPIWTITDGIRYVMVWTDLGLGQVSEERIGDAWAAAILAKLEAP